MKSSIQRQLVLGEVFDLMYGIYQEYDDLGNKRIYANVAIHASEERMSGSLYDRWLREFIKYKVTELTGLSFKDFLLMDMESAINTMLVCHHHSTQQGKAYAAAKEEMDEMLKKQEE